MSPDKLRVNPKAVQFVKHFIDSGKPVAAMSHGVWTLIDAGGVKGRKLTSWPSLQTDIRNAGGHWVDEEFVMDQGLLTSRQIENMRAFTKKLIDEFAEREGKEHQRVA
jgi:protease I